MLRFEKLTVCNFGPFKGEQTIDFTQKDGVTIIWGSNGRGKTTLLNVFRYALFGYVKGRKGTNKDYIALSNLEAREAGEFGFSITMKMNSDGDKYILSRDVHLRDGCFYPLSNEDFMEDCFLRKNGTVVSVSEREHILAQIMPNDISRFFLFDGELLQEYEALLDEDSTEGDKIKTSIEKILGMPVLTNGISDISDYVSELVTARNKAAQNDKNTAALANSIASMIAEVEGHKTEMQRLQGLLDAEQDNLDSIKKRMDDTEKLRDLLAREAAAKRQIESLTDRRNSLLSEIQIEMKSVWQTMVAPVVSNLVKDIQDQISAFKEKRTAAQASQTVMREMEYAIRMHHCEVCDQDVSHSLAELLNNKLKSLREKTPFLTDEEKEQLDSLQKRLHALQAVSLVRNDKLSGKFDTLNSLDIQISDEKQNLSEIKNQISTYGDFDSSIGTLASDYSKSDAKITELKKGIADEKKAKEDAESKRDKLNATMSQKSKNKDVLAATARLEYAQKIQAIFEEGIEKYRIRLKQSVESDASSLFTSMSSDKDYESLRINDNYGLEIIHKKGTKVPSRSAGFEHVVALSLIGALHKNAPLQGPVIMDSPFGRLDPKHKENVTRSLPQLSEQVILLVYDGEIEKNQTRELLGGQLIKEYHLERVTSFQTKIV